MKKKFGRIVLFDEISVDNMTENMAHRERPLKRVVFFTFSVVFLITGAVALFGVVYLGGIKNDFYRARADSNVNKVTITAAERGYVTDRYGEKMVNNIPSLNLRVRPSELIKYGEEDAVDSLLSKLGITEDELNEILSKSNLEKNNEVVVKKEISALDAIVVETSGLKSLYVAKDTKRVFSDEFSHVVGYVGLPNTDEMEEKDLSSVDVVGKTNLEAIYDSTLRGINGKTIEYRNVKGELLGAQTFSDPVPGADLKTTIDAGLQNFFYRRLNESLIGAGPGGVGIAINPLNGEILSLVSLPGFSSANISDKLNDPAKPLFNRAITGLYSPGSTIKLIVAAAALKEKIIGSREMVLSTGHLDIPNKYDPDHPTKFVDWKAHGWVDIYSALARSSNIFFYAVGGGLPYNQDLFMGESDISTGLGVSRLKEYYSLFKLDKKTGITLSAESVGYLPSAEDKRRKTGSEWTLGDTYNISIGQGDLLVTPIALINAVAAVVNGGTLYKPNLILGNVPERLTDLTYLKDELAKVMEGMKDAVSKSYGTAVTLNTLSFETCGKTGSAQVSNKTKTNAFFVGCGPLPLESDKYAPICILVLVENAKEGSLNAVPVAYDVFKWYYENRVNVSR
ncbi:MAG: penicillin-binding transpeptidase domain-containing protein [Parcubacteria group bacterium]